MGRDRAIPGTTALQGACGARLLLPPVHVFHLVVGCPAVRAKTRPCLGYIEDLLFCCTLDRGEPLLHRKRIVQTEVVVVAVAIGTMDCVVPRFDWIRTRVFAVVRRVGGWGQHSLALLYIWAVYGLGFMS